MNSVSFITRGTRVYEKQRYMFKRRVQTILVIGPRPENHWGVSY